MQNNGSTKNVIESCTNVEQGNYNVSLDLIECTTGLNSNVEVNLSEIYYGNRQFHWYSHKDLFPYLLYLHLYRD